MFKNLLLIPTSILLTLLSIELLFRVFSGTFYFLNSTHNITFADSEIRILCIGESTTAFGLDESYPSQLKALLTKTFPQKKFTVINKGVPGINTKGILQQIDSLLRDYNPHMVIAMMGINDSIQGLNEDLETDQAIDWWREIRLFKLYKYILSKPTPKTKTPKQMLKQSKLNKNNSIKNYADLGLSSLKNNTLKRSLYYFDKYQMVDKDLNHEIARQLLFYTEHKGYKDISIIEKYLNKWIENFPKDPTPLGMLATTYSSYAIKHSLPAFNDYNQKAKNLIQKYISLDGGGLHDILNLANIYYNQEKFTESLTILRSLIKHKQLDIHVKKTFTDTLFKLKKYKELEIYLAKEMLSPNDLQQWFPSYKMYCNKLPNGCALGKFTTKKKDWNDERLFSFSHKNYTNIINKVSTNKSLAILVQYPRKSQKLLHKLNFKSPVVIVDNLEPFDSLVKDGKYNTLFSDNFAGSFGHATAYGNKLLATNILHKIKYLFKK